MADSEKNGKQGRKPINVRLENTLDTEAIEAFQAQVAIIDKARKSTSDKAELEKLAKKRARYTYNIRRVETRMSNRLKTPKEGIDLEDLL